METCWCITWNLTRQFYSLERLLTCLRHLIKMQTLYEDFHYQTTTSDFASKNYQNLMRQSRFTWISLNTVTRINKFWMLWEILILNGHKINRNLIKKKSKRDYFTSHRRSKLILLIIWPIIIWVSPILREIK